MRYKKAYTAALQSMSKGDIYYIPCIKKAIVRIARKGEEEEALNLNKSVLDNAIERGHVQPTMRNSLAHGYALTDKGQRALLNALESRVWEGKKA